VLEEERHERKHAEELVAHNTRQLKGLQERLTEKVEESRKLESELEKLKTCKCIKAKHDPLYSQSSLAKEKEKRQLDKQASQLSRDVADLERMLGVTIRGAGSQYYSLFRDNENH